MEGQPAMYSMIPGIVLYTILKFEDFCFFDNEKMILQETFG